MNDLPGPPQNRNRTSFQAMSTLAEIDAAADSLPIEQKEELRRFSHAVAERAHFRSRASIPKKNLAR